MNATQQQIGGSHYKDMPIQPVEFIHRNGIPFIEGSVIKYVSRWRNKGGIEDLKKARHFLKLLIEMEGGKEAATDAKQDPIPWPARYEVGMKFRRKDGEVVKCSHIVEGGADTVLEGNLSLSSWWYSHGERTEPYLRANHPGAELVEYLGKD